VRHVLFPGFPSDFPRAGAPGQLRNCNPLRDRISGRLRLQHGKIFLKRDCNLGAFLKILATPGAATKSQWFAAILRLLNKS